MLSFFYRISNALFRKNLKFLSKIIDVLTLLFCNSYVPGSAEIGKGTKFAYGGIGIVIHGNAKVGKKCIIGQGITIGAKEAFSSKIANSVPEIGDNVYISAGARLLGGIKIGSNSIIGANSVVLESFPPNSILVGSPAKCINKTDSNYLAIR